MVNTIGLGAVDGPHLNGGHGIHPLLHGKADHMIHVTFFNDVRCGHIIGTKTNSASKGRVDFGHCTNIFF